MTDESTAKKETSVKSSGSNEDKPTCLVIPTDLKADLKHYATLHSTSMSDVVNKACVAFLKKKDG
jgi:hypothetical protein